MVVVGLDVVVDSVVVVVVGVKVGVVDVVISCGVVDVGALVVSAAADGDVVS